VVQEIRDLAFHALVVGKLGDTADVVMRADEDQVIRLREEAAESLDLGVACLLTGADRVEADDDQGVGCIENACIERGQAAVSGAAFDLQHRLAGLGSRLFDKGGKIPLHDVIEEARHALVKPGRIRQFLESGVAQPAAFEQGRKPVLDHRERGADLALPAPGVVQHNFSTGHCINPLLLMRRHGATVG
jgi:hypothetical protein